MEETIIEPHPFDYEKIKKGLLISTDDIERASGVCRNSEKFPFALMGMRVRIMKDMAQLNTPVVAKITGQQIEILHDAQAVEYTRRMFNQGIRQMADYNALAVAAIDRTKLETADQQKLDRQIEIQSRYLQSIKREKKLISAEIRQQAKQIEEK